MASAGREAAAPAEGESSLLTRPSWLPSKGSTPPAPRGRGQDKDAKLRKSCNCRNSRCLKLYCECFASGQYCFGCNCQACHNNPENDEMRKQKESLEEKLSAFSLSKDQDVARLNVEMSGMESKYVRVKRARRGCLSAAEAGERSEYDTS